ncbi:MAG: hypothetical protein LBV30_03845 [Propionibacteriaceae bacterium]|jgi:hypothetical protein|nr:hypothetical protein [Propionibacteriaceae bacterium]
MAHASSITADQAPLPRSIPAVQRMLSGEIVYPFLTKLSDKRAGRRDRPLLESLAQQEHIHPGTPWMQGLGSGFLTAAARERRDSIALQAPLRAEAAKAIARFQTLQSNHADLEAAAKAPSTTPLSNEPTTFAEKRDGADQILRRRQREDAARLASNRARVEQSNAEQAAIRARLSELEEEFDLHEEAYKYRAEALRSYYGKRQATYLSCGLRTVSVGSGFRDLAKIDSPTWQAAAFPQLSTSDS